MTERDHGLRPAWKRQDRRGSAEPAPPPAAGPGAAPPVPPAPAAAPVAAPASAPASAPAAGVAADVDDADLERGRTLAVIAAMGRLQMSLDVLARQQKKHQENVEARLARIERALTER